MHPQLNHAKLKELQSKEESKQSRWPFVAGILSRLKNLIVPSGEGGEIKYTPALRIYLAKDHGILTGKVCLNKSPVEVIADITCVYNSLYKAYLQIDNSCHISPNCYNVQKVCISIPLYCKLP